MRRKIKGINWLADVTMVYANGEVYLRTLNGRAVTQSTINMIEAYKHVKS